MHRLLRWKTGTLALMAMTITTSAITPFVILAPANAQYNINQPRSITIPANVTLPVTYEKEKVIVSPGETATLTLKIPNDIIDRNRTVLIPGGTEVVGRLEPVNLNSGYSSNANDPKNKGVRFVAQELVYASGRRQAINATSQTITRTEKITKGANTGTILTDAVIGASTASVIALLTGNKKIEILETVGGGVAGAVTSVLLRKKEVDVFVLRPERDLKITLNSSLVVSRN
ncbi:hypothetical protein Cylst_3701 [Cylindrospermum stagnale PCC 7417]|uniref:Bacterial conjugation TrbI-like protein n=1 Tax=Cylindrospermum stagnale PCC 7417 TaxID=56107 RepID=K9WZM9_9NOST|nr:hypothetical protein [Cylindrospermum stagnale]AFZ25825.1 hypothetical protein Cylst_3701 [Cylindrospermum stagnale PCC 7417]